MVKKLLLFLPPDLLLAFQNHLVTCTLTIGCKLPGKGAMAQSCDLCFNWDST
jgi:hypothetical protein